MLTQSKTILLYTQDEDWLFWVALFLTWIPELILIVFAIVLLFGIVLGVNRFWVKWVLVWVPYGLILFLLSNALKYARRDYTQNFDISEIITDSHLFKAHAPTFLAIPVLFILHIALTLKSKRHNKIKNKL